MSAAARRLGWGDRRLRRNLDNFAPIVIGGRTFVDSRKVDDYIAAQPDLSGMVTAAEAARLLAVGHTHFVSRGLVPVALVAVGPSGPRNHYRMEDVLRVFREREDQRRQRDARRAKRENRRRDLEP